jgi:ATP-dependent DNA ligase
MTRCMGSAGCCCAIARPANYVVFDLLALDGTDLRREPLRVRRRQLQQILTDAHPSLLLSPATEHRQVAPDWLDKYATAQVGIEGIVAKGLGQPYRGGARDWLKYRYRDSVDVIVGAVTGSLTRPERLVLGLYHDGALRMVGGTSALTDLQQSLLARLLVAAGDEHPWPAVIGGGHVGYWGGDIDIIRVRPDVVVEVAADNAFEHGRWRHVTTFVRPRPDLRPGDTTWPRGPSP